jgi:hypothetical protein
VMTSPEVAKVSAALVKAQADIRAVEKSATNPHFRSKYVPLDAIIAMARPALAKHGIAIVQAGTPFDDGKGLLVETRLVHESGEWISGVVFIPFGKADPQGAGAAMTYGRRFGLSALLSISSEEDDDGNSAVSGAKGRGTSGASNGARQTAGTKPQQLETAPSATRSTPTSVMPFGKSKGQPTDSLDADQLSKALDWAVANKPEQYKTWIEEANKILVQKVFDLEREPVGV